MREVFLVISDLHLSATKKENRISYDQEMGLVFTQIFELIYKYKNEGADVNILLLGDIFDRSYKTPHKYGTDSSFFIRLKNSCKKVYTVVGNHELHFYINNPFWTLVNEIKSDKLSLSEYNVQPLGYDDTIEVVDSLDVGNVAFHFNHFGCEDNPSVAGKINIGLYHKPIYNQTLIKEADMLGLNVNYTESTKHQDIAALLKYDYAFLGHMHWFYGAWKEQDTVFYGLGSLGRPSASEIQDNFLERNIPAIILEDNCFLEVEDNFFDLLSKEETLIPEIVEDRKELYEINKVIKEAKNYQSVSDDPIRNIETYLIDNDRALAVFKEMLEPSHNMNPLFDKLKEVERSLQDGV